MTCLERYNQACSDADAALHNSLILCSGDPTCEASAVAAHTAAIVAAKAAYDACVNQSGGGGGGD